MSTGCLQTICPWRTGSKCSMRQLFRSPQEASPLDVYGFDELRACDCSFLAKSHMWHCSFHQNQLLLCYLHESSSQVYSTYTRMSVLAFTYVTAMIQLFCCASVPPSTSNAPKTFGSDLASRVFIFAPASPSHCTNFWASCVSK